MASTKNMFYKGVTDTTDLKVQSVEQNHFWEFLNSHHTKMDLNTKSYQGLPISRYIHLYICTLTDVCIHTAEFQSDVLSIFTTFQIEF